jgi:hypothetical protein
MKKLFFAPLIFFVLFLVSALSAPLIPAYAAEGRYEAVTVTSSAVTGSWTALTGSNLRFSNFRIYERSGLIPLKVFGGGNTYNASAYFVTIPAGTQYSNEIYKSTTGIYVSTTATGVTATVEFESKRPASYWPWR